MLRGLGFVGVLTRGMHHQAHQLVIVWAAIRIEPLKTQALSCGCHFHLLFEIYGYYRNGGRAGGLSPGHPA